MIRNDLHLLEAPQHRRQQDREEEQDPSCHARGSLRANRPRHDADDLSRDCSTYEGERLRREDPSCHAREAGVVGAAPAHVGGHALQSVPAVGAGLQVARVVRFHDQAMTFSDGKDGEESTVPAKTMGVIYGLGLPADETV